MWILMLLLGVACFMVVGLFVAACARIVGVVE